MPRGYRCFLPALAGIAALVWAFSSGLTFGALIYPQQERDPSYRYANDKPLEIEPAPVGKANPETFEYRYPCSQPKGKDESDLCAQWKAARAAEASALWAERGFWATVAGSLGLLVTITQSAAALQRAKDANEIAQNTARHQLRAYVGITKVTFTAVTGDIWITFKNTGQTLATDFMINTRRPTDTTDLKSPIGFIQPGQEIRIVNDRVEKGAALYPLNGSWFIRVGFHYRDIYGKPLHVWHFTFFCPPGRLPSQTESQEIELFSAGGASYRTE